VNIAISDLVIISSPSGAIGSPPEALLFLLPVLKPQFEMNLIIPVGYHLSSEIWICQIDHPVLAD
jgi:hypothetical protein